MQGQEGHKRSKGKNRTVQAAEVPSGQGSQGDCSTGSGNEYVSEVAQIAVHRHHDISYLIGIEHTLAELLIKLRELFHSLVFVTVNLYDPLAGNHLLNESVDLAEHFLPLLEVLSGKVTQFPCHHVHYEGHHY